MNGMYGMQGMDPQMLQMMMQGQGGQASHTGYGQPQLMQPQQYTPPPTANLGLPTMPQQQETPGLQPGAANQQMAGLGQNFGQGWQGMQSQPQQNPWMGQGGNMQNIGMAMLNSGLLR